MGRRWRSREKESQSEEEYAAGKTIISISSDEDKEKALDLSTSYADEIAAAPNGTAAKFREALVSEAGEVKKKQKKRAKKKKRKEVEKDAVTVSACSLAKQSAIYISSDDEEANRDLSLEIVSKSRLRELKRKRVEDKQKARAFLQDLSTSSAEEIAATPNGTATECREGLASEVGEEVKKKQKKRAKKKKEVEENAVTEVPSAPVADIEPTAPADPVAEVNETSNNLVLRKLLRGPRYFDSVHESWESCYNCGEEGHVAANCKAERRQKPCFFCGMFGHTAKHCMQGQDCFICKRKGHHAKDCPHKREKKSQEPIICLRCGDLGHDMASCRNNYSACDIKEIQCYICKKYGHLCCVDYADNGPSQISCYNCAESGHTGQGCAKQRGENNASTPSTFCYVCGQEGHFARGCTKDRKSVKRFGESSTPSLSKKDNRASKVSKSLKRNGESAAPVNWSKAKKDMKVSKTVKSAIKHYGESSTPVSRSKDKKHKKDSKVSKSLPKNYGRNHVKGSPYFDGSRRPAKSKIKGGWIVDDMINLPIRKHMANDWASPMIPSGRGTLNHSTPAIGGYSSSFTPSRMAYNVHAASSGGRYLSPYTPHQRDNYYAGTPYSRDFSGGYRHSFSASRFGNSYDYYG